MNTKEGFSRQYAALFGDNATRPSIERTYSGAFKMNLSHRPRWPEGGFMPTSEWAKMAEEIICKDIQRRCISWEEYAEAREDLLRGDFTPTEYDDASRVLDKLVEASRISVCLDWCQYGSVKS